jgi:hypothetical protein
MKIFGVECKEPKTVIITREQAETMIVDHISSWMTDQAYIRDCIRLGVPSPMFFLPCKPIKEWTLNEIVVVMDDSGMIDSMEEPDVILISENDEVRKVSFYRSAIVR